MYSQDLSNVIRSLLQTNPDARPSCEKILKMSTVVKRMKHNIYQESEKTELLKTIRGDNIFSMADMLPKANYFPIKIKKARGMKSLIDSIDEREGTFELSIV